MKITFLNLIAIALTTMVVLLSVTHARPKLALTSDHPYSILAVNRAQRRAAAKEARRGH